MENLSGIPNIGNTCYLNSAIQLFLRLNVLTKFIKINNFNNNILHSYKNFLNEYSLNKPNPSLIKNLIQYKNTQFNGFGQNDAHECLLALIDIINDALNDEHKNKIHTFIGNTNIPIKNLLNNILDIHLVSTLKCSTCNYISITNHCEKILSVPITNETNKLEECIDLFETGEYLTENNKWKCDKCNEYVCAYKKFTINCYPKYLLIHLKRFNIIGNNIHKINKSIYIPNKLNLHNYNYCLTSYILHSGGPGGGHYVNYFIKNNKTFLFNDNTFSETNNYENIENGYIFLFSRSK